MKIKNKIIVVLLFLFIMTLVNCTAMNKLRIDSIPAIDIVKVNYKHLIFNTYAVIAIVPETDFYDVRREMWHYTIVLHRAFHIISGYSHKWYYSEIVNCSVYSHFDKTIRIVLILKVHEKIKIENV